MEEKSIDMPQQLASSSGYLWVITQHYDTNTKNIFKVDSAGNQISNFVMNYSYNPVCVTYDGTNLWFTDARDSPISRIRKYSTSGVELTSINSPCNLPSGIVYSGGYLYIACVELGFVYKITTSGTIVSNFSSPSTYPYGMAFDGSYFWILDAGTQKIYKVTTSGTQISNFNTPAYPSVGLAYDGTDLWVSVFNGTNIYKVSTSGSVLGTISTPQMFTKGIAWQSVQCTCGSWQNGSCGSGGCNSSSRYQTRTCTPSGCDVESQCVNDPSCSQYCDSGACCDLSTNTIKPNGAQPTGKTDDTDGFCDGSNSPTGTSYVRTSDYYCNGIDTSMYLTTTLVDTCGTCEYCTNNDLTCNYYDSSTSCGTNMYCDGYGNCIDYCHNGLRDRDETDVDCGGSCSQCEIE